MVQTVEPTPGEQPTQALNSPISTEELPASTPIPIPQKNTRYELIAELEYDNHKLAVTEQIQYINKTSEPIPDLQLMVEPGYYSNVFKLHSLTWENGKNIEGYTLDKAQIRIPLPERLLPGEQINLSLTYELDLPSPEISPNIRPIPFGYTERQTNLVDWYPFVPPYIPGEGWLAHEAGYYGEHLAYDMADFNVHVKLLGEHLEKHKVSCWEIN